MAQTVSPPPADAPRPLPRRGAASPKGVRAPRLVPQDIFWAVALAALALTVSLFTPNSGSSHGIAGAACAAGTTGLLYLLGWRARDRAAGIVAGLLLATSLPFAAQAVAVPREALGVLLAVAALFAFVAGSSLLALAFAGLGALARPEGLLLGLLLLLISLAQRRRRAGWGAAFFLGIVCVGGWVLYGLGHTRLPALHMGAREGLLLWAFGPGMVFSTWLLLPFCAELGEAPRRARWLPVVLWTLTYFAVSCFVRSGVTASEFTLLPLWSVLAAGGLSRLLPAITELPMPWARYALATLAVLSPLAVRLRAEWPQPPPSVVRAITPVPPSAHSITATIAPSAVTTGAAATVVAAHPKAAPAPPPRPIPVVAIKPQPKPVAKKPVVAAPKPHPVARPHAVYHSSHFYRPRRTYRRFFRHF